MEQPSAHHIEFAEPVPFNEFFEKCNNTSTLLHEYCDPTFNFATPNIHIACVRVDLESTDQHPYPRLRFAEQRDPGEFLAHCDVVEDVDFCRPSTSSEVRYIYVGCGN